MNTIVTRTDPERPALVAFASGKGGTGTSTAAAETARAVARRTDRVLAVDASPGGESLSIALGASTTDGTPARPLDHPDSHLADYIVGTGTDDLWLASLSTALAPPRAVGGVDDVDLVRQCHDLDFDCVLVDLPTGIDPTAATLFTLADLPILVTTPDRAAVGAGHRLLQESLLRSVDLWIRGRTSIDDSFGGNALSFEAGEQIDVERLLAGFDRQLRDLAAEAVDHFEPYLLVNDVREKAQHTLAPTLVHAWDEVLGIAPRPVATLDHRQPRRRETATGDESLARETALSGELDGVARMLLDVPTFDDLHPRPLPDGPDAHPARRLGLPRDTDRDVLRQHCRRVREGFGRFDALDALFDDPDHRRSVTESFDELYRSMLQQTDARSTDADRTSESDPTGNGTESADPPSRASDEVDPAESDPTLEPSPPGHRSDSDLNYGAAGKLVRRLRRRFDLSLDELSTRTQIGVQYLTALETGRVSDLPRQVYLRGYLRKIARAVEISPTSLLEKYFDILEGDTR